MQRHRASCQLNYNTTDKVYTVEKIVGVFGHIRNRFYKVKYEGYPEPEWSREHLFRRDGCAEVIRDFWGAHPELSPAQEIFLIPGEWRCLVCNCGENRNFKSFARRQDLKTHITRTGHDINKLAATTTTAIKDAVNTKREQQQASLPRAKWGNVEAANSWRFKYLGSIFQADGKQMPDVKRRIAMARTRFGKLRHVWEAGCLHLNLKL